MRKYWLALLASTLLWGTSFPAAELALGDTGPGALLVWRSITASLSALALVSVALRRIPWEVFRDPGIWALGAFNSLAFFLQFAGQVKTGATEAAILVNTYVFWVALLAPAFLSEKTKARTWAGVFLGVAGASLVVGGWPPRLSANLVGNIVCLGAALSFTAYILVSRGMAKGGYSAVLMTFGLMGTTLVFSPLALVVGPVKLGWDGLWWGAWLGVGCSTLPYVLYSFSLKKLSAAGSSVVLLLEVVVAGALAYLFLGERLEAGKLVGALLVLLAAALVPGQESSPNPPSQRQAQHSGGP